MPRWLGVDLGRRRIGLALSDPREVLATPLMTIDAAATVGGSADRVAGALRAAAPDDDLAEVAGVVVGLPKRLGGEDTHQTADARAFASALAAATRLPVHLQDERLTSHEADQRLAFREGNWRKRKARLDAASAAVILQDFLDARAPLPPVDETGWNDGR